MANSARPENNSNGEQYIYFPMGLSREQWAERVTRRRAEMPKGLCHISQIVPAAILSMAMPSLRKMNSELRREFITILGRMN